MKRVLAVVGAVIALAVVLVVGSVVYAVAHVDDLAFLRGLVRTRIVAHQHETPPSAPPDPPPGLELVRYPSQVGSLAAYVTPMNNDGRRRAAVVWAKGGAGGIGDFLWGEVDPENDQSARAFRERDIVVMYPSWRGENDNPGSYEMFYGEVDDLLAARDYVRARPDVDPNRIYLMGHSTGATITLLATIVDDGFRAAVCFGPWLMLPGPEELAEVDISGFTVPFDINNENEAMLRSPLPFLHRIERPTWFVEGFDVADAAEARADAAELGTDAFTLYAIPGGNHFDILHSATALLAEKIATSKDGELAFTEAELIEAWSRAHPAKQ